MNKKEEMTFQAKDQATLEHLRKLRHKVLTGNISTARRSAYKLSWLQEDGLMIFKGALFGDYSREAKKAAAYGLRNMKGRMKKMAIEVLEQGKQHPNQTTRAACIKSIQIMRGEVPPQKSAPRRKSRRKIYGTRPKSGNVKDPAPSPRRSGNR